MTNGNLNYHFVSKTASHYNICVAAHLGLALFSSIFDPDMSSAIAVLGIISVVNASVPLLFLVSNHLANLSTPTSPETRHSNPADLLWLLQYLIFAPASILVDIIRLATVKHVVAFGFLIVLRICSMIVRVGAFYPSSVNPITLQFAPW